MPEGELSPHIVNLKGQLMASVHSVWASTIPSISGTFTAGEWSSAGTLPMPGGYIMVKNDANFLYLALDLVSDTGNTP